MLQACHARSSWFAPPHACESTLMSNAPETLANVPLFRSLEAGAIRQLDAQCRWRQAAPKQWLIEYGDLDTDVYFLTSGSARALINTSAERDVIFSDVRAGEYFGELAAIDGKPRSTSVLALTQATVACMPASVFRETLYRHAAVAEQVFQLLVARIRMLSQRVHEFSTLHVKHRICAELLRRSRPDPHNQREAVVSPPPTHAEIAAHVGTRREMVARELKTLERAGLLARRRGALVLPDVHGLIEKLQVEP
jgi:CRP/FNR family cyclic AMP-dependent transcriptional regulator